MASGIQAALAISSTATYTPTVNAKVKITAAGTTGSSGWVTANGVVVLNVYFTTSYQHFGAAEIYVAAGQSLTVATNGYATAIVSSLEAA